MTSSKWLCKIFPSGNSMPIICYLSNRTANPHSIDPSKLNCRPTDRQKRGLTIRAPHASRCIKLVSIASMQSTIGQGPSASGLPQSLANNPTFSSVLEKGRVVRTKDLEHSAKRLQRKKRFRASLKHNNRGMFCSLVRCNHTTFLHNCKKTSPNNLCVFFN